MVDMRMEGENVIVTMSRRDAVTLTGVLSSAPASPIADTTKRIEELREQFSTALWALIEKISDEPD